MNILKDLSQKMCLAIVSVLSLGLLVAVPVQAQSAKSLCEGSGGTWSSAKSQCSTGTATATVGQILRRVASVLSFLVGAVAVIMLIIGGLRYVLANGDANAAASAKNTILYAVIGLVVAGMAYALANFVLDNIK